MDWSTEGLRAIFVSVGGCELVVQDDGIGFDTSNQGAGFGILGMEERARALGGTLATTSAPAGGTTVRLALPLPLPRPAAVQATIDPDEAGAPISDARPAPFDH